MTLAIFDLDNTLLCGDSDYLWGEFMVANGIVDEASYRRTNERFYRDYQRGELDNDCYLAFALEPLSHHNIEDLYRWRRQFLETWIKPIIAPGCHELLNKHRALHHTLLIISATNLFITKPIAELLGIPIILATEPEQAGNRYTGRYLGTPTFREGKVTVLQEWMKKSGNNLDASYFYSDSINDLPLLELVQHPVAVNPEASLKAIAIERSWEIADLR